MIKNINMEKAADRAKDSVVPCRVMMPLTCRDHGHVILFFRVFGTTREGQFGKKEHD